MNDFICGNCGSTNPFLTHYHVALGQWICKKRKVEYKMEIDNRWRSSTVVDLCAVIHKQQDYSMTPILADALMDSGCDDNTLLNQLRDPHLSKTESQRLVCLLSGGQLAEAVRVIEEYAKTASSSDYGNKAFGEYTKEITYEHMIKIAEIYSRNGQDYDDLGFLPYDIPDLLDTHADKFWKSFELVTRQIVPNKEELGQPFYCSC